MTEQLPEPLPAHLKISERLSRSRKPPLKFAKVLIVRKHLHMNSRLLRGSDVLLENTCSRDSPCSGCVGGIKMIMVHLGGCVGARCSLVVKALC
jgi:hypothetical protein